MPSEGMTLPWIAIDHRVRFAPKCCLDLGLRCFGNKLVLLSQVHKQGRTKLVDPAQILFGVSAVISHGGIDLAAHGREERHQGAESRALAGTPAPALAKLAHRVTAAANT